jgi:hypothetical protein
MTKLSEDKQKVIFQLPLDTGLLTLTEVPTVLKQPYELLPADLLVAGNGRPYLKQAGVAISVNESGQVNSFSYNQHPYSNVVPGLLMEVAPVWVEYLQRYLWDRQAGPVPPPPGVPLVSGIPTISKLACAQPVLSQNLSLLKRLAVHRSRNSTARNMRTNIVNL